MRMKITVVGCGAGAFATAADLSFRGHGVTLYVSSDHSKNFDAIRESKGIFYLDTDKQNDDVGVFIPIDCITHDPKKAFEGAEMIFVVAPTFAHESIAYDIAPYVHQDDVIILSPGSTGGALVFKRVFDNIISEDVPMLGEFHTLPYAARKNGNDGVRVLLHVDYLLFAAMPARYNLKLYRLVSQLYPATVLCSDVVETSLNNGNATTHPAPMVCNAGKIEQYGKHNHYSEGITPSVANVIQILDDERKSICRSFGYKALDIKDRLAFMGYCPKRDTVYEAIRDKDSVFMPIEGPHTLQDRYLIEDAPYSLVAMRSLAKIKGIETPVMDSVAILAGALLERDYLSDGRVLASMGLDGMTIEEVKLFLKTGKKCGDDNTGSIV